MTRFLTYVSPAVGHAPAGAGLLELRRRGLRCTCGTMPGLVPVLQAVGLEAAAVAPAVLGDPVSAQADLVARGPAPTAPDLDAAIAETRPDVLLVDVNAYGAQIHAERSGIPTRPLLPSVVPVPGRDVPTHGTGMRPIGGAGRPGCRTPCCGGSSSGCSRRRCCRGSTRCVATSASGSCRARSTTSGRPTIIALTAEPLEVPPQRPAGQHPPGRRPVDPPAERPAYLDEPGDRGCWSPARRTTRATRTSPGWPRRRCATSPCGCSSPSPTRTTAPGSSARQPARRALRPHGHVLPSTAAVVCHGAWASSPARRPPASRRSSSPGARPARDRAPRHRGRRRRRARPKRLTPEWLRDAVRRAMAMSSQARAVARQLDPAGAPGGSPTPPSPGRRCGPGGRPCQRLTSSSSCARVRTSSRSRLQRVPGLGLHGADGDAEEPCGLGTR